VGAYLIELKLKSDDYAASDSFYIVFNRGLSEAAFESSVDALVAVPVPEPSSYILMLAGMGAVGLLVRRRRSVV
ncbi:MAG: PEP-CTERM sorting domain-containing protein, partial [Paucibacter sp.]|nr:PEP-CTERM sorting domain-containing protein [Roseateles sp.]